MCVLWSGRKPGSSYLSSKTPTANCDSDVHTSHLNAKNNSYGVQSPRPIECRHSSLLVNLYNRQSNVRRAPPVGCQLGAGHGTWGYHACAREYPAGHGTWRMSVRADRSMPFSGTPLISAERPADVFMSSARIIWYLPMKQGGYLQTRHDTANVGAAHLVPLGQ